MHRYKAAIFDLDGTLLNTLEDLADSVNYVLEKFGYPKRNLDEIKAFVGNGIENLIKRSLPTSAPKNEFERLMPDFKTYYAANCNVKTRPYDGILQVLKKLKSTGYNLALVSNKADFAVKSLSKIYFEGIMSLAVGARDGFGRKPAPDTVLFVLSELKTARNEAVYIGDSDIDIITAENAGIDCISVDWGFRSRDFLFRSGAKVIVSEPHELLKLL